MKALADYRIHESVNTQHHPGIYNGQLTIRGRERAGGEQSESFCVLQNKELICGLITSSVMIHKQIIVL